MSPDRIHPSLAPFVPDGGATLGASWRENLVCLDCHVALQPGIPPPGLACPRCQRIYPASNQILEFTGRNEFYEREGFVSTGADFPRSLVGRLKLRFARHHYLEDIARHVVTGSKVIEIGCGGGSRYLAANYDMLGIDLSSESAREAAKVYRSVIRADCVHLPLKDASVDAIVSSFVLEHLEGEAFDGFFREMRRVLRPGGRMVHYFDLENDAPFTRWAKAQPWYHALFVVERGHYCLRAVDEWQRHFVASGFRTVNRRFSCKTWLQDLSIWGRLDDDRVTGSARIFGRIGRKINRGGGRPAEVLMGLFQDAIERFLPDTWASKAIWVVEKAPAPPSG